MGLKLLTGPWVSKADRTDLYRGSSHDDVIKHIVCRLYASETKYWNVYNFAGLPDQTQGNRLDGGPAQADRGKRLPG